MILAIILFALGLILILKGGDWFVESSVALAKKTKIPSIIIGATVVAIATTLPEILVTVLAAANHSFDIAVGNAVGTMICNASLILGLVFLFFPKSVSSNDFVSKTFYYLFVCLLVFACSLDLVIVWWECVMLLVIFLFFIMMNLREAKHNVLRVSILNSKELSTFKMILFFVFGAVMIGLGALLLVEYGSQLAHRLGISEYVIGVTLVAVGTCLPELVTAIQSVKRKNVDLTIGNIIGANIINGSLLIGLSGLVSGKHGLPISYNTLVYSLPYLFVTALLVGLPILLKGKTYRWQGFALLITYIVYIIFIILI